MRKIALVAIVFTVAYVSFLSALVLNTKTNTVAECDTDYLSLYPIRELPVIEADDIDLYMQCINDRLTLSECHRIKDSLRRYALDDNQFYIMLSIISIESKFHKDADSFLGAVYGRGLAQVSEIALEEYNLWNGTHIRPTELYDIDTNIRIACFTYQHLSFREELTIVENVMAYNKGLKGYRRDKKDLRYYYKFLKEYSNFCS